MHTLQLKELTLYLQVMNGYISVHTHANIIKFALTSATWSPSASLSCIAS